MVGLILTVIGYVLAIAWIAWRIIRIPAVNLWEQDSRILKDGTTAFIVFMLGNVGLATTSNPTVGGAAFLLALLGIVFLLVTLAADIKFTHIDK